MQIKQVALVRFDQSPGFAGEPITWVKRVRFFNSKKKARLYYQIIYERINAHYACGYPIIPFYIFTRGTEDFQTYAIERQMQEPSREEIERYTNMKNKKVDKDFQDYLDDLCGSCHRTMEECYTLPGIAITNRDHIVVKCNKYACITMPEPEDFHMALNVKQKNLNEN